MSEETLQLPTNAEDLKRHKALSAMESTSTVADDDSAASTSTNTTSDPSALGEALGSISAVPAPTPPKPANVAVKVKQEDVALVVSPIIPSLLPSLFDLGGGGGGGGGDGEGNCIYKKLYQLSKLILAPGEDGTI